MNQGNGGNQGNRGYEGNNYGHNQGQQYPSSSNMQYNYTMNQPYAANMANMGYQEQYYPQQEQYGAYGEESYEEADYDNLDEIDRELNRGASNDYEAEMMREIEGMQQQQSPSAYTQRHHQSQGHAPSSGPYVPQSAVPSQNGKLSSHAHEFWFPECRNCPCCKGFKHGCDCCKASGVDTCKNASCIDGVFESQVNAELATRTANAPPAPAPAAAAAPAANTKPSAMIVTPPAGPAEFCKYEKTPGGCRFGAGCRFVHANPPAPAGGGYGGAPAGGATKCSYFARGNCQYGDNCRFAHY